MTSDAGAPGTPRFNVVLRGYDRRQVDEHVARLQRVIARMRSELDARHFGNPPGYGPPFRGPVPPPHPGRPPHPGPPPPGMPPGQGSPSPQDPIGGFTDRMQRILQSAEEEAEEIRNRARVAAMAETQQMRAQLSELARQRDSIMRDLGQLRDGPPPEPDRTARMPHPGQGGPPIEPSHGGAPTPRPRPPAPAPGVPTPGAAAGPGGSVQPERMPAAPGAPATVPSTSRPPRFDWPASPPMWEISSAPPGAAGPPRRVGDEAEPTTRVQPAQAAKPAGSGGAGPGQQDGATVVAGAPRPSIGSVPTAPASGRPPVVDRPGAESAANRPAPGQPNSGALGSGLQDSGAQRPDLRKPEGPALSQKAPGPQQSGPQEPGPQQSGPQEPGPQQSGPQEPGLQEPGLQEPGLQEPGLQEPGRQESALQGSGSQEPGPQGSPGGRVPASTGAAPGSGQPSVGSGTTPAPPARPVAEPGEALPPAEPGEPVPPAEPAVAVAASDSPTSPTSPGGPAPASAPAPGTGAAPVTASAPPNGPAPAAAPPAPGSTLPGSAAPRFGYTPAPPVAAPGFGGSRGPTRSPSAPGAGGPGAPPDPAGSRDEPPPEETVLLKRGSTPTSGAANGNGTDGETVTLGEKRTGAPSQP